MKANFHIVLAWAIKPSDSDQVISRVITRKELRSKQLDRPLISHLSSELATFDRIVTFYGSRFDVPFVRTRSLYHHMNDFPLFGSIRHTDAWLMARSKLKLHSNRLAVVAKALNCEDSTVFKDSVDWESWIHGALRGDKKSLDTILDHNKRDVLVLERVYRVLEKYVNTTNTSI